MRKVVTSLLALSTILTPVVAQADQPQPVTQEEKVKESKFDSDELAKIDKEADKIWVDSAGDKDKVKEYLTSKGFKFEGRKVAKQKATKPFDQNRVGAASTDTIYTVYMDFYRVDAYKVKVWTYVELEDNSFAEPSPAAYDRLAISWDSSIQNKSSEDYNFYTNDGKSKSDYSSPGSYMAKSESGTGALAYRVRDGWTDSFLSNYIKKAYIQVTFSDPKSAIGTGPYTTYYTKYEHTYGGGTTSWKVGFPWTIEVSGSTTEVIDSYADDLSQYAP